MKFTGPYSSFDSKMSSRKWPAMSANMSQTEHVLDALGRRLRNRVPPPANVAQLSQILGMEQYSTVEGSEASLIYVIQ